MSTLTIEQKQSNTGSVHDLASDMQDRVIDMGDKYQYVNVTPSYFGDNGHYCHRSMESALKKNTQLLNAGYNPTLLRRDGIAIHTSYGTEQNHYKIVGVQVSKQVLKEQYRI